MIGERIRELREERGMSLSVLASRSGVSKSYISNIERGIQKNPSLIIMKKLAETLGVPLEDLTAWKLGQANRKLGGSIKK
ncbi:XRE family transcriptional regulator, master regulator for biofilm formation [Thalassobacillus cyri]|uniref:XRE family transcriptional regulator, master regulator for biofilm formation n=1 Tax=Thalassobacillus cyri TaxID=571932 RepID=A0A1H4AT39_9BACI|nr:helix-turn-helix transcriptional regulator [Thalassobacillus cyri]SEA38958.1 XRE family transcriptional regulator, master regulator for biofilm formation [Thalassobacillus cyri]